MVVFVATRFNPLPWRHPAKQWAGKMKHIGIRDYGSMADRTMTRPTWGLARLQRRACFWDKSKKVAGINAEKSGNDWGG